MGCKSSRHAVPISEPVPTGKVTVCLLMDVHCQVLAPDTNASYVCRALQQWGTSHWRLLPMTAVEHQHSPLSRHPSHLMSSFV